MLLKHNLHNVFNNFHKFSFFVDKESQMRIISDIEKAKVPISLMLIGIFALFLWEEYYENKRHRDFRK